MKRPCSLSLTVAEPVVGPERDRARKLRGETRTVLVTDVDHGLRGLCEQAPLRLEVLLHRPVEVEVILGQVREDEDREARPLQPSLRRRHRRRLHHADAIPRSEHLAEEALQVDRLRCVEADLAHVVTDSPLDVGQQARLLPGRGENRRQEIRSRRLPVRARDRRDRQLGRRVSEELDSRERHRGPHARHDQLWDFEVEWPLDDERDRPLLDRCRSEVVAVCPRSRDAEKQRVAQHLPRVVRQLADLGSTASNDVGRSQRCDEPLQLHIAGQV